jgi:hypothetical protein
MITESKKTVAQAVAGLALAVGMILLVNDTRTSGEALESFKFVFSSNVEMLIGVTIVFLAVATLVALHVDDIKRILKHH